MGIEGSAAEAIAAAAGAVQLERGSIRITARLENGRVIPPVELVTFRVPSHAIGSIVRGPINVPLLEHAAAELGLAGYARAEIIAEYEVVAGAQQFRWLDLRTWQ